MAELRGLTQDEVKRIRLKYGTNVIAKTHRFSIGKLFISQFVSPLMIVLLAAGTISYFLHGIVDAIVVYLAVILNGLLGFYQEFRAERALEALEKQVEATTEVVRDGERVKIKIGEVVVGDLAYIAAGGKIPADGLVVQAESLTVSEAMLTGESMPVEKEKATGETMEQEKETGKVYMGTAVLTGIGTIRVTRVGGSTAMGEIAQSLKSAKQTQTMLQRKMASLARVLTVVIVGVAGILFVVGMVRGMEWREIFLVAVAVAVSAIPEGLAVALTVILVIGMQRLLKRKGLVRKLLAAEALGSVSVVCSDKTGTLTYGEMRIVASEGKELSLAEMAQLCNDLSDPIEVAMKEWGETICEVSEGCLIREWKRTATMPFVPELKYAATEHHYKGKQRMIVRGAPEVILTLCKMSNEQRKLWARKIETLALRGFRLVGLAEKLGPKTSSKLSLSNRVSAGGLTWAGLLVMEDPVRPQVKEEIQKLGNAGVTFKVVTGDYAATAGYVMKKLGIEVENLTITGDKFRALTAESKRKIAKEYILFARFSPDDKLTLVKALQHEGEVVAMMGDGINDAPALKTADVGIVVSSASDVSKETADMILLDDQFGTVIAGIEEGRGIYERIKKVVRYLLSDSFSEVILISVALFIGLPLPVTAAQILWVNLANDTFPALALSQDKIGDEVVRRGPVSRKTGIIDRRTKLLITIVSLVSGLMILGMFWYYLAAGYPLAYARTVAFTLLGIDSLLAVFVIRDMSNPIWRINPFDNIWLLLAVGIGVVMQLAAVYLPALQALFGTVALASRELILVAAGSMLMVLVIEIIKMIGIRKKSLSSGIL